jgi:hypothetical protein
MKNRTGKPMPGAGLSAKLILALLATSLLITLYYSSWIMLYN